MLLFGCLRGFFRFVQMVLIISIATLYVLDLSGSLHEDPNGGLCNEAVRNWYNGELSKIPAAKKVYLGEPEEDEIDLLLDRFEESSGSDAGAAALSTAKKKMQPPQEVSTDAAAEATVLENGVATRVATKGMKEFYGDDICQYAEEAVGIRKKARYEARAKGSLLFRVGLHVRDLVTYGDTVDFTFDSMLKHKQKRNCIMQKQRQMKEQGDAFDRDSFSCKHLPKKALCVKVYEGAKRSNEYYNRKLNSFSSKSNNRETNLLSEEDPHGAYPPTGHDQFFGFWDGYAGFVVESSIWYTMLSAVLGTGFEVLDRILSRRVRQEMVDSALIKERERNKNKKEE